MSYLYNNYCKKCRNRKYWESIRITRVRQILSKNSDGKRITIRLTKFMEENLPDENISNLIKKLLAYEIAKNMSIEDDHKLKGVKRDG